MKTNPAPVERIVGIDYGTVRIGLAIGDTELGIAGPLAVYERRTMVEDAKFFQRLAENEGISRFVVGLPIHLSGDESEKSREAREFGNWLAETTGLPVEYYDERFTTSQSEDVLLAAELTKKKRKARRDMVAAQMILAGYLDSGGHRTDPGGIDD